MSAPSTGTPSAGRSIGTSHVLLRLAVRDTHRRSARAVHEFHESRHGVHQRAHLLRRVGGYVARPGALHLPLHVCNLPVDEAWIAAFEPYHWSIADPAAEPGSAIETCPAFERTAAELETRIRALLHRINDDQEATKS